MIRSKTLISLALAYVIGLGCSLLTIPVPAPPVLMGALLVLSLTVGYLLTDKYIIRYRRDSEDSSDD